MALEEVTNALKTVKWVILTDDDTILRLLQFLSSISYMRMYTRNIYPLSSTK